MWRSAVETDALLSALPDLDKLDDFFAMAWFWSEVICMEGYVADESWISLLHPTEHAKPYLARSKEICTDLRDADVSQALFCLFRHHTTSNRFTMFYRA